MATPVEDALILKQYTSVGPMSLAPMLPGRSVTWIRQRAFRLGVARKVAAGVPIEVGDMFGCLLVLKRISVRRTGASGPIKIKLQCLCQCGNEKLVDASHLKRGTKSCGCQTARLIAARKRRSPGYSSITQLLKAYTKGAQSRALVWELTRVEFKALTEGDCYYCGVPPAATKVLVSGDRVDWNGVDRVDNDVGYIPTNCVSCCKFCNLAKGSKTIPEFLNWVANLVSYYSTLCAALQART